MADHRSITIRHSRAAGNMLTRADSAIPTRARDECVTVTVPARLHLGFLDLDGGLGRRFGGLGLTLDAPCTRLRLWRGGPPAADGPDAARARAFLDRLARHFHIDAKVRLTVDEAIPEHVGLGSGTQLALAAGVALCRLYDIDAGAREVAAALGRGTRSGIGIGAFEQGGVLLDGGRGDGVEPPPIVSRFPFPEPWRVLLIADARRRGRHGDDEAEAFHRLPPFGKERAGHLCRLMLMAALPALAEEDLDGFGAAVAELQRVVGDYFAPFQGGRFSSPLMAEVLAWLDSEGVAGVGQSSWGPTGFALVGSEDDAQELSHAARRRWAAETRLTFAVRRGRNRGGEVAVDRAARPAVERSA